MKLRALLIVAACLLVPAGAPAASLPTEVSGSTESFTLRGTNGYEIAARLEDRRVLTIEVSRGRAHEKSKSAPPSTIYEVASPQPKGSEDIDASIGGLGRIDVHFAPGKTKRIEGPPRCMGLATMSTRGHFVGTIDFHGERDYTTVRADSVAGVVVKTPHRTCNLPKPGPKPRSTAAQPAPSAAATEEGADEDKMPILALLIHDPRDRVQVAALRPLPGNEESKAPSVSIVVATAQRHLGPVKETGLGLELSFTNALGLRLPKPLEPTTEADYSPPAPLFSGSATFRHPPGAKQSWAGNLAVEFPGFGRLPLTGAGTHAAICVTPHCQSLPGAPTS